jgi:hypothetical protein
MSSVMHSWKLALLWACSLVLVGVIAAAAQAQRGQSNPNDGLLLTAPTILASTDVGFRLERVRDGVLLVAWWYASTADGSSRRIASWAYEQGASSRLSTCGEDSPH